MDSIEKEAEIQKLQKRIEDLKVSNLEYEARIENLELYTRNNNSIIKTYEETIERLTNLKTN